MSRGERSGGKAALERKSPSEWGCVGNVLCADLACSSVESSRARVRHDSSDPRSCTEEGRKGWVGGASREERRLEVGDGGPACWWLCRARAEGLQLAAPQTAVNRTHRLSYRKPYKDSHKLPPLSCHPPLSLTSITSISHALLIHTILARPGNPLQLQLPLLGLSPSCLSHPLSSHFNLGADPRPPYLQLLGRW